MQKPDKDINLCVRIIDGRMALVSAMAKPCAGVKLSNTETIALSLQSAARAIGCELVFDANRIPAERLAKRLLDPEDLGHAVTREVRDIARDVLGVDKNEFIAAGAGV